MSGGLRVSFGESAFSWADGERLTLRIFGPPGPDDALVIDIYDLDNPVHPEGHHGWWKFPADTLGEVASVRIEGAPERPVVTIDGVEASDRWVNPEGVASRALAINAVVRHGTTNAILDLVRIPGFADAEAIRTFRSAFDRDESRPRYAPAPFVPARGETIRIVVPNIAARDGVGNLCLELHRMLRQSGVPVQLYAQNVALDLNDIVSPYSMLADDLSPADQILYFYSTHDPELGDLMRLECRRKVCYYHGVTNPDLLRVFDTELSVACRKALDALGSLRGFDRLAANSLASAQRLAEGLGAKSPSGIAIVPPQLVPLERQVAGAGTPRGSALLTVCQLRPHKKVEDVLRLLAAYRALVPEAELHVVGHAPSKAYRDYLHWVETRELQLPAGCVHWHGSTTAEELGALYGTAAAFVSMSEDEGFCLPIVEAMRHGLPVLAHGLPAVRETMGGAGLTFSDKDHVHLAEAIRALLDDPLRLEAVVEAQYRRAAAIDARMTGAEFYQLLD